MFEGAWILVFLGIAAVYLPLVLMLCARWRRIPLEWLIAAGAAMALLPLFGVLLLWYVVLARCEPAAGARVRHD